MDKELSWNKFCNEVVQGQCLFDFHYKDFDIQITPIEDGFLKKTKRYTFSLHGNDKSYPYNDIYSIYRTPQMLLENVRIEGKSLEEIWNELELD